MDPSPDSLPDGSSQPAPAKPANPTSRRRVWRLAVAAAAVLALAATTIGGYSLARYQHKHPSPRDRVFPLPAPANTTLATDVIWRMATSAKVFSITFDDGPDPAWTPQVLEILARHNAKATFFQLGQAAQTHPELVRAVLAGGHEIGLHRWNHDRLTLMDTDSISRVLDKTKTAIQTAADDDSLTPSLFRPTYGRLDSPGLAAAAAANLTVVMWSQALHGGSIAQTEAEAIARTATPGMIILGHDGRMSPDQAFLDALDHLLDQLDQAGLRSITVSDLLAGGM